VSIVAFTITQNIANKERVDENIITSIRKELDEKIRKKILKETVTVTGWVYESIKRICSVQG